MRRDSNKIFGENRKTKADQKNKNHLKFWLKWCVHRVKIMLKSLTVENSAPGQIK